MKISWFGHDSFLIETSGKIIYIDPFVLPRDSSLADLILVTHEHYDHCSPERIREIQSGSTQIITSKKASEKLSGNIKILREWDVSDFGGGIKIQATPAYNLNKPFHPKGSGLGFIIGSEGKRIYHAGDTDFIPEMNQLGEITVALLPISGVYVMDLEEAVKACLAIKPKIAIPMHYNYLENLRADPKEFKKRVEERSKVKVEILEGRELKI
jgi:L-ascorbate metabolism protein UlaG (beta-lactamase superfamily)